MLDRGASPKKDPLASLSRKKIHGHDHLNISIFKKYMCSCNHLSTNLYVQSLQSYICGLYKYKYKLYVYMVFILLYQRFQPFHVHSKSNGFQLLVFYKNEERPLPREV